MWYRITTSTSYYDYIDSNDRTSRGNILALLENNFTTKKEIVDSKCCSEYICHIFIDCIEEVNRLITILDEDIIFRNGCKIIEVYNDYRE